MQFAGVLPEDAPDPRARSEATLLTLSFSVMGMPAQPTLEDTGALGTSEMRDSSGFAQRSVSIGYTLWRNPADRDDPANLAVIDAQTRASIEQVPPWPRPAWLIEAAERLRYPQLWEAVRTTWNREPSEHTTLSSQLLDHADHILMNQFREELGLAPGPTTETAWRVSESAINHAVTATVDGIEHTAAEIDTDPFVYAIGVELAPDLVATAVIPREHLPYVRVAFETRSRP